MVRRPRKLACKNWTKLMRYLESEGKTHLAAEAQKAFYVFQAKDLEGYQYTLNDGYPKA